ncbi:MAG: NAD(P)H-hydrate dehydratase, partial [Legionella sp.]
LQLEPILNQARPVARLLHESTLPKLPQRKKNSHKGHFGHVLIIGGGLAMAGAAALAAKAAMRAGAGLVSIATRPEHSLAMLSLLPEAMVYGIHKAQELAALLAKATVCVIGPGLGETEWAQALFLAAITSQLPMVIDASALRLLALHPQVDDNWVLTPHPGEAGSLLSTTTTSVQQDRYQAAAAIQQLYGGVVVLKGAGTIIQTSEHDAFVCVQGNPGMATAGMGDVLTGIIAGLCAQQLPLADAAKLGVWLHAQAGDHTAKQCGERGILASDLLDLVPKILNSIET